MIVRLTQERDVERCSTPTTPEAAREMKPTSNCANQLRQKAAYVAWSACACSLPCVCGLRLCGLLCRCPLNQATHLRCDKIFRVILLHSRSPQL